MYTLTMQAIPCCLLAFLLASLFSGLCCCSLFGGASQRDNPAMLPAGGFQSQIVSSDVPAAV
jgi:hypothetical protein